jgi:hypothetical protein
MTFDCEAYGEGSRELGIGCFVGRPGGAFAPCREAEHCRERLTRARQRLYRLIQQRAAAGDTMAIEFAAMFPTPDHLLGGPRTSGVGE